ncbi:MAG TPA: hypothetical protein VGQ00_00865 [Candidatus Norongarragalinales archaeon]|nr:hypothetical protein [Candidatus Norongarragalinales archaeon]
MEKLKHVFYVPTSDLETNDPIVGKVESLLEEAEEKLDVPFDVKQFERGKDEEKLKQRLLPISVTQRVGFKKTRKGKALYQQLVVFKHNMPLTFYSQVYGEKQVAIEDYLKALMQHKFIGFHQVPEIMKRFELE